MKKINYTTSLVLSTFMTDQDIPKVTRSHEPADGALVTRNNASGHTPINSTPMAPLQKIIHRPTPMNMSFLLLDAGINIEPEDFMLDVPDMTRNLFCPICISTFMLSQKTHKTQCCNNLYHLDCFHKWEKVKTKCKSHSMCPGCSKC